MTLSFSWFPGHMAKGLRQVREDLKLVDLVLLLLDARIPRSSRHVPIESLLRKRDKGYALILNKTDLAEPEATRQWIRHFEQQGVAAASISAVHAKGLAAITRIVEQVRARVKERALRTGRVDAPVRLLVAGIPNVGKSTLINSLTTRAARPHERRAPARTGKLPGVTRSRQWVAMPGNLVLRDTPGILFPRIESQDMFLHLAATGAIKEDNLPLEEVGEALASLVRNRGLLEICQREGESMLGAVARSRGMLTPGAVPDMERAARYLLKQIREGRWGPLTLELPD